MIAVDASPRVGPPFHLQADTDIDGHRRGALLTAAERLGLEIALPVALAPLPRPAGSVDTADA
jgi:hypothetical protein